MAALGHDLAGQHACHIVSRARGGPDHIDNLTLCAAPLNLALGHRGDDAMCRLVGRAACRAAKLVTEACGPHAQARRATKTK